MEQEDQHLNYVNKNVKFTYKNNTKFYLTQKLQAINAIHKFIKF